MLKIFTAFNHNPDKPVLDCGEGLTRQSDMVDCDINRLVKRFLATGEVPTSNRVPQYIDTTDVNFERMQGALAAARSAFYDQPYAEHFDGPEEFLRFFEALESGSKDARDFADEIGLTIKPKEDLPTASGAQPAASATNAVDKSVTEDEGGKPS